MKLAFTPQAWADYLYWQEADPQISARIRQLIKDAMRESKPNFSPQPSDRVCYIEDGLSLARR